MIGHLIAHAIVRGSIYRIIWHAPALLIALLFIGAIWYLARDPGRGW